MHGRVFGATSSLLAFVKEGHELPDSLQAGFTGVSRHRPRLKWRAGWRPAAAGSASTASTDAPQGTATACRSRRRGRRCRRGRLTNRAACQQRRQSGCGQRRRRARRCCRAIAPSRGRWCTCVKVRHGKLLHTQGGGARGSVLWRVPVRGRRREQRLCSRLQPRRREDALDGESTVVKLERASLPTEAQHAWKTKAAARGWPAVHLGRIARGRLSGESRAVVSCGPRAQACLRRSAERFAGRLAAEEAAAAVGAAGLPAIARWGRTGSRTREWRRDRLAR